MTVISVFLGGKTPDPHAKGRSYAEIMGEVAIQNAKVGCTDGQITVLFDLLRPTRAIKSPRK
jgi:hypothetical protein